jgi:hypothetical protein
MIVPATHTEMSKIREAKRIMRERALRIAEEEGLLAQEDSDDSYASADPKEDSSGS